MYCIELQYYDLPWGLLCHVGLQNEIVRWEAHSSLAVFEPETERNSYLLIIDLRSTTTYPTFKTHVNLLSLKDSRKLPRLILGKLTIITVHQLLRFVNDGIAYTNV